MTCPKSLLFVLVFLSLSLPLPANSAEPGRISRSWPTMGTFGEVVVESDSEARAREAIEAVRDVFERINRTMTVYRKNSDINRVNHWAGHRAVPVDPWVADLVSKARRAAFVTGGAFSIDVLAEGMARGLKPRYVNAVPPGGQDPFVSVTNVPSMVYLHRSEMALDLGGIAKGYALDRAAQVLNERGLEKYLINLGRNVAMGEAPAGKQGWPLRVAGENRVRRLSGQVVSVSQQGIRSDTAHVIGPGGRTTPTNRRRVVVSARKGWVADMASTALMVDPGLAPVLRDTYGSILWIKLQSLEPRL